MGNVLKIENNTNWLHIDNHIKFKSKESILTFMINENKISIDSYHLICNLEETKEYVIKKLINLISGKEIFILKHDILFLYLYQNNCVNMKVMKEYVENSINSSLFYNPTDEYWIIDFHYMFYFDILDEFNKFRKFMSKQKSRPYDDQRHISIDKFLCIIDIIKDISFSSTLNDIEIKEIFPIIKDFLSANSIFVRFLTERYNLLFFKIMKYLAISNKQKFENICKALVEKLWYTNTFNILKEKL